MLSAGPIGVFDSGYGGLTVLKEIVSRLPQYDYLYLGDNARSPYGTRSFETVYQYSLQAVRWLFSQGCPLVIIACNTASAKALRTIQQKDLPHLDGQRRVLGIIRPVTEVIGHYTKTGHVGIFGTPGTVASESYVIEIKKFFPSLTVIQEACPIWVPLVECFEHETEGADFFVKKHIDNLFARDPQVDAVVLGCTHYPLLMNSITKFIPSHIHLVVQGKIVAESLENYLQRHPEIRQKLSTGGTLHFYTSEMADVFEQYAAVFFGQSLKAQTVHLQ